MSRSRTAKQARPAIPDGLKSFARHRLMEMQGMVLIAILAGLTTALATWSATDPSWSNAVETPSQNALGYPGAVVADKLISWFALGNGLLIAIPAFWAAALLSHRKLGNWQKRLPALIGAALIFSTFLSSLPVPQAWPLGPNLGGSIGDAASNALLGLFSLGLYEWISATIVICLSFFATFWLSCLAMGFSAGNALRYVGRFRQPTAMLGNKAISASSKIAQSIGKLRQKEEIAAAANFNGSRHACKRRRAANARRSKR